MMVGAGISPICLCGAAAVDGGGFPTCRLWPLATKKGVGTKATDVAPHHIVRGLADRACGASGAGPVNAGPTQSGNGDGGESPIFPGGWGQEPIPQDAISRGHEGTCVTCGPTEGKRGFWDLLRTAARAFNNWLDEEN